MSLFSDGQTMYPQGAPQFQQQPSPYMPMAPQQQPPGDGGMLPPAMPSQGAEMPVLNGPNPNSFEAPGGSQMIPTYVGNPLIDKYIHTFIGEERTPGKPATAPNPGRPSTPPVEPMRQI